MLPVRYPKRCYEVKNDVYLECSLFYDCPQNVDNRGQVDKFSTCWLTSMDCHKINYTLDHINLDFVISLGYSIGSINTFPKSFGVFYECVCRNMLFELVDNCIIKRDLVLIKECGQDLITRLR